MNWIGRNELVGDPLGTYPEKEEWFILSKGSRARGSWDSYGGVYRSCGQWWYIISGQGVGYEPIPAVTSLEEAKAYVEMLVRMK